MPVLFTNPHHCLVCVLVCWLVNLCVLSTFLHSAAISSTLILYISCPRSLESVIPLKNCFLLLKKYITRIWMLSMFFATEVFLFLGLLKWQYKATYVYIMANIHPYTYTLTHICVCVCVYSIAIWIFTTSLTFFFSGPHPGMWRFPG